METQPVKIPFDYTIDKAAQVMLLNKISSAPIVDDAENLNGVISQTDIFRLLVSLTGVDQPGYQYALQLEDRPGSIKEVTDIIRGFGGRIVSILSSYHQVPEKFRKIYIRAFNIDRTGAGQLKEKLYNKFTVLYIVEDSGDEFRLYENYSDCA